MLARLVDFRITAFMLGGDIGHVIGDLYQLVSAIVGLPDDALVSFGDVVLVTDYFLETQSFSELGCDFHRLVIDGVAPIKADQWGGAIIPREKLCTD